MLTSSPAVLLLLALLADASAIAQPSLPNCEASPHRIELLAAPTDKAPEVCISPDLPTTFRFDSPLPPGAVELQERERFEDVSTGTRSITVIPPKDIQSGERLKLKEARAWQLAPIPPGGSGFVMVETELLAHEARGTFTLKLWDENGGRLVPLGGVTFP